jgi:hypothetical protein
VAGLDASEVEFTTDECRELGHRFIDHSDDEPVDVGRPAEASGKAGFRSKTQRRLGSWRTKRNGPLPTGRSFHEACRRRSRGTLSSR